MSLLDEAPRPKLVDMGEDPGHRSDDEEDGGDIDEEEGDGMQEARYFPDEYSKDDAEDPKESKVESVVVKEGVLEEEVLCSV